MAQSSFNGKSEGSAEHGSVFTLAKQAQRTLMLELWVQAHEPRLNDGRLVVFRQELHHMIRRPETRLGILVRLGPSDPTLDDCNILRPTDVGRQLLANQLGQFSHDVPKIPSY